MSDSKGKEMRYRAVPGSHRQNLPERIKALEEKLGQIVYFLSHDFRSRMVTVCGFTALFCEGVKRTNNKKEERYARKIEENIQKMDVLMQKMIREIEPAFRPLDFRGPKPVGRMTRLKESGITMGGVKSGRAI